MSPDFFERMCGRSISVCGCSNTHTIFAAILTALQYRFQFLPLITITPYRASNFLFNFFSSAAEHVHDHGWLFIIAINHDDNYVDHWPATASATIIAWVAVTKSIMLSFFRVPSDATWTVLLEKNSVVPQFPRAVVLQPWSVWKRHHWLWCLSLQTMILYSSSSAVVGSRISTLLSLCMHWYFAYSYKHTSV